MRFDHKRADKNRAQTYLQNAPIKWISLAIQGFYFHEIRRNTGAYIHKRDDVRAWLKRLRTPSQDHIHTAPATTTATTAAEASAAASTANAERMVPRHRLFLVTNSQRR